MKESVEALQQRADETFGRKVPIWVKLALVAALVVAMLVSFALGQYGISPSELVEGVYLHFFDPAAIAADPALDRIDRVLFSIRFPRICLVILVGAALAVAGASFQGMFRNPLVSPDILGAAAGASVGACGALLLNLPGYAVQILAFCGGMLAVAMAVWINRFVKYDPILGLVLGGILVSTLFESGTSLIKLVADANDQLPAITFWLMGSFSSANNSELAVAILPMAAGFVILILESWKLNVLSFGDEEARALGVDTKRTRLIVIFASTLLTSVSVAVAGIVGWIGLVIPHLARAIVGPNYRVLLPTSMFVGAVYLLIIDNISRLVTSVEIPIGILTSIIGVPFFVFIFRKNMKGWR